MRQCQTIVAARSSTWVDEAARQATDAPFVLGCRDSRFGGAEPIYSRHPVVQATRATTPIVVDGQLNDEVWLRAPAVTEFTQREPDEGQPVTEATELRIAYDDSALYVGARLKDLVKWARRGAGRRQ